MNEQEKLNRAKLAEQILENPVYQEAMTMIRASYVQALTSVKKGKHYEAKLKDIHDSLQNLDRIERTISRFYESGKIVTEQKNRLFNR